MGPGDRATMMASPNAPHSRPDQRRFHTTRRSLVPFVFRTTSPFPHEHGGPSRTEQCAHTSTHPRTKAPPQVAFAHQHHTNTSPFHTTDYGLQNNQKICIVILYVDLDLLCSGGSLQRPVPAKIEVPAMTRDDSRGTSLFACVDAPNPVEATPSPTPERTDLSPKTQHSGTSEVDLHGFAAALAAVAKKLDAGERRIRASLRHAIDAGDVETARRILAAWDEPPIDSERTS